jgi:hypothetical protein
MTDQVIDAPAPVVDTPAPAPVAATPAAAPAATPAESPAAAPAAAPAEPAAAKEPVVPDNWRELWADGDEKLLKRLERVTDPKAAMKILREQDKLIAAGKVGKPLAKDATTEQIAEWREANGVPAKPEDYDTKLDDGLVFGEDDKAGVDSFLQAMHGANATPAQVKAGLGAYAKFRDAEIQQQAELDSTEREQADEVLREAWGGNYKQEKARIAAMLAGAPEGVKDILLNARHGKSGIFNKPEVVQFFAGLAREINPTATIVPAGGNKEGAISTEIKDIESKMYTESGAPNPVYWKDEAMQARYRDLTTAASRLK